MTTLELPTRAQHEERVGVRRASLVLPVATQRTRIEPLPQVRSAAAPAAVVVTTADSDTDTVLRWMPLAVPMAAVLLCASIGLVWAAVL